MLCISTMPHTSAVKALVTLLKLFFVRDTFLNLSNVPTPFEGVYKSPFIKPFLNKAKVYKRKTIQVKNNLLRMSQKEKKIKGTIPTPLKIGF